MKSVLLSIKPKYCELIASGKKTVEIRKNRPKIDAPFKCYIYCTKRYYRKGDGYFQGKYCGKVIGEFVCDGIYSWGADDLTYGTYYASDDELNDACITNEELWNYAKGKTLYAWHISDLVIYDKPKELSEFYSAHKFKDCHRGVQKYDCDYCFDCGLTRPPQSWCYVEENTNE